MREIYRLCYEIFLLNLKDALFFERFVDAEDKVKYCYKATKKFIKKL